LYRLDEWCFDWEEYNRRHVLDIFDNIEPSLMNATVLVVSDQPETARIWAFTLKQMGLEVCLSGFSERTLQLWSEEYPDLIVLEVYDNTADVFDFCRRLRDEAAVPILFLTSRNDEAFILEAYRAGADECVPHPVSPRLFMVKIQAWLRRSLVVPSATLDVLQVGGFLLDPDRKAVMIPTGDQVKLTNLESRLLYLLMSHQGWILETDYLVERVWGHFGEGDSVLLKNVVYRLRRKIEPDPSQPRYLLTESSIGYKFQAYEDAGRGVTASTAAPVGSHSKRAGEVSVPGARDKTRPTGGGKLLVDLPEFRVRGTAQLHAPHLPLRR
jgi:two-component system KDP operon response regulator KdpE